MFDKRKDNPESAGSSMDTGARQESHTPTPQTTAPGSGKTAIIGPGIKVNGDISGKENLVIEGEIDGKVQLPGYQVEIGHGGKVNADVTAQVVKIAGELKGDVTGKEKVIISRTGNVHGNIVAPRMTLEDGAKFKGSIDMDPGSAANELPLSKKTSDKAETKSPGNDAGKSSKPTASSAGNGKTAPSSGSDKEPSKPGLGL